MSFSFGAKPAAAPSFGGFQTPNPQQPSTAGAGAGGSLFGSAPAQPANPAASTSLFGSTTSGQPAAGTSTGLFGSAPAPAAQQGAGTGLFGSTTQPQQAGQTGGLLGSTSAPGPAPSGGLFGSSSQPAQQGGLFGSTQQPQQQQGGGLFDSTNQQPQQGGGLFGSTTQQPQQGGGLFGSTTQQPQQSGGLFGSTNNAASAQPAQGSSLFGSTAGGGGLFGQNAAKPAGTGMFGSTTQSSTGGGLFGSTAQPQQPQAQQGGGLFGGFGQQQQQQQQQQQPSLFGSTNNLGASTTATNPALFSSTTLGASTSANPFGAPRQELDIESRITQVQGAWDTNSPDCRFKYFFYNVVEVGTTSRYGRPAGANDDAKWAKALRDNPDANTMVPVLAVGWADVKKREQQQENLASVHQQRIKEINQALSHTRQTSLSASIRLSNLQAQQTQLLQRLIHLTAQTPQFVPLMQSSAFRQEEAETQAVLEGVKAELEGKGKNVRNGGSVGLLQNQQGYGTPRSAAARGRLLGQVNELWGQLEEIRRRRKVRAIEGREGWLGDEKALGEVAEILATQQMALQKLSDLAHDAIFDADVMRQGLGISSGNERQ